MNAAAQIKSKLNSIADDHGSAAAIDAIVGLLEAKGMRELDATATEDEIAAWVRGALANLHAA